ncbi:MAG: protein kinase, partial [Gemmatimonadetes bacterium]|nr:protein kinase [Gemmatimonadota bacterium]
ADGFLFYVMPFIKGESLQNRLDREKQLPVEDALRIAQEVAGALDVAHEEGVIHRDVKPANILLERGHALLADFGIAQAMVGTDETTLTGVGMSLGTPSYMSPEQAAGEEELEGRSDQYSLACVLYEMLAGKAPFTGAVANVLRQHVAAEAPSVVDTRPTVPEHVQEVLDRALAKSPADRFKTTGEMAAALALTTTLAKGRSPLGRAKAVVYGATVILGLATVAVIASIGPDGVSGLPEDYVAVFPFENLTGDPELDDLGSAAAYLITDGLSRANEVRGVATKTVEQALVALGEGGSEIEAAASLGVGLAITGVITRRGDLLQLLAQITGVETGEVSQSVEASGAIDQPMEAVDALRERVLGALAVSLEELFFTQIARPPSYDAFRAHQRGLEIFITRDLAGSLPHFQRAYQLDSTFLDPLIMAAHAHSGIGDRAGMDPLVRILEPRRDELSAELRLQLELFVARLAGDREGELRATRTLAQHDPVSWGLLHANVALGAGRPAEALQALERVDYDSPFNVGFSPLWERLAIANQLTGRYREALEAARQGRERFPEAMHLPRHEVRALIALDRLDEIEPLLEAVESMEPERGFSPGLTLRQAGTDLARYGHSEEARALAERSLDWFQSRDPDGYHWERARALLLAGRPEEALLLLGPPFEENPEDVFVNGFRGIALALTGDREGAEAEARWLEELDRPYLLGMNTAWRAAILAHLDRTDEATRLLRQALQE